MANNNKRMLDVLARAMAITDDSRALKASRNIRFSSDLIAYARSAEYGPIINESTSS
jgi:hypothetical protein